MTIGAHKGRAAAFDERAVDARRDERKGVGSGDSANTDAAKEAWVALTQNIAARVVQLGGNEQATPAASDAATRTGAGKLTFGAAQLDGSEAGGVAYIDDGIDNGSGADRIGQLRLEMDGGRLGTVYLTVQRQGTAVSVVVGVADPIQRALVELELGSLTQALRTAGLNVGSVRVLHPEAAGIAFAQARRGMTFQSTESASSAYRSHRVRQQTDAEEGLDVVG